MRYFQRVPASLLLVRRKIATWWYGEKDGITWVWQYRWRGSLIEKKDGATENTKRTGYFLGTGENISNKLSYKSILIEINVKITSK